MKRVGPSDIFFLRGGGGGEKISPRAYLFFFGLYVSRVTKRPPRQETSGVLAQNHPKMQKSPSDGVGINWRCPSHSDGPPRLAKHPRSAPPRSVHINVSWMPPLQKADRERYTTAPRSVKRLPGLAQNRYQDSAYLAMGLRPAGAPAGIEYCGRRFDGGLQNAEIAFQPPWYKFEMPCPLLRPSQTRLGRSARAPIDRGPWGLGGGVVGSDHPRARSALGAPSAASALGWVI